MNLTLFYSSFLLLYQTEKETLESSPDTSLKGHAIKLLENGKNLLLTSCVAPIFKKIPFDSYY
jgi:hypothetical protein